MASVYSGLVPFSALSSIQECFGFEGEEEEAIKRLLANVQRYLGALYLGDKAYPGTGDLADFTRVETPTLLPATLYCQKQWGWG